MRAFFHDPRAQNGPKRVKKVQFTDEYTLIRKFGHEIIIILYVSITSIINVIFVKLNNPHTFTNSANGAIK